MKIQRIAFSFLILALALACQSYHVERSRATNIHLDSLINLPQNSKMEAKIKPYRDKVVAGMSEVLCKTSEAIYGGRPESPLTNLCADLTLEESNRICAERYKSIHMDVAMINRGGLRIPIPKGEIKTFNMFELMPFENEVVFLRLKGDQLLSFIDHLAERGGEGVAGLKFGIRNDKAVQPLVHDKAIDSDGMYWLVTSDYIANGGDGCEMLSKAKERIDTGVKARDMFISYFRRMGKEGKMISAKTDGRIYDAK
ncbi:MAG: 5'-nucleotidase C-terminal domain-containing protein [Marinilabiliales bacterium]|nr:5'-nucleotidase C-terminal domain-containing protein [Marinilabiliales bacterium]